MFELRQDKIGLMEVLERNRKFSIEVERILSDAI